MIRVFCFVGSLRQGSCTKKLTNEVVNKLTTLSEDNILVTLYDSFTTIDNCIGCRKCFAGKICPLYEKDKFNEVILELLRADIIIFATPVYLNNVSSTMKNFLDRIAFLTHLMPLPGKIGVVLSTADAVGIESVNVYLKQIQTNLGIKVIGELGVKSSIFNVKNTNLDKSIEKLATVVMNSLEDDNIVKYDEDLNKLFRYYRDYFNNPNSGAFKSEKDFWIKNGLVKCENFSQLVDLIKNNGYNREIMNFLDL